MTRAPVMTRRAARELPLLRHDSRLRLLLIEDSRSDSDLVRALLEDELPQADIDVADNLEDALLCLSQTPYDATLADLSLPDAEGVAVVSAVRAAHPDTALLVLTGRVDGELALWALAEGAQDYLVKGQHDGPRLATALLHALQRQRAEQEAQRYLQLARGLLDAHEAPTCTVDDTGAIIAVNAAWRAFTASTGGDSAACGEGSNYLKACEQVPPDSIDAPFAADVAEGLQGVLTGRLDRYQHEYPCHAPGGEGWFSVRISRAEIYGSRGAVVSHVDVSEMHAVQTALSHQALHDALTGLPNRVLLTDRLSQALADNERHDSHVAVAFLDIDHFKRVNDSLGHQAGDALLVQVAQRLRHRIRAGDTLARFSGDEFVVVWRDLDSTHDVPGLGDRLTEALKDPFDLGSTSVNISVSIGIVVGHPMQSVDDLLMAADAAMYDAKRHGRSQVRLFTRELRTDLEERMSTEVDLRAALMRSELVLHYQPVMDLASGRPVAVEALVRWQHPERGLLGPNHFIPVAESSNLIVPLGRWVLEQACGDAVTFSATGAGLDVAVNVSVRQLTQPQFHENVRDALTRTGLDPRRLMLEVTESVLVEDAEAAASALDAVAALGVSIAIDDFGTGYSSLHYLRRYPVSALKLDRAFVSDICQSPDDAAICSSVIGLAHAVGATSIAEGVETTEQYETLRRFGCQQAQGYLWSPAVPVADLADVLNACVNVPAPSATASGSS